MILQIIVILILIVFSAFFSASETAIFSLSATRLRRMQTKGMRVRKLKHLLKRPSFLLSTIVFGNMLVNIGLASFSTILFVNIFAQKGIFISIIFSGSIILFFGEIFPKTLSIYLAEGISLFSAPILEVISNIFYPVILYLQKLSEAIANIFLRKSKKPGLFTEDELKTAILLGKKEGAITEAEEELISYVLKFKDTQASQIITPRIDVKAIDIEDSQDEVIKSLKEERHSKFPVYEESMDNVKGILYSKDAFLSPDKDFKSVLREAIFVPESKKIDDILEMFIRKNERIAIVLDEYGGTAGIVTFEDIIEEIFGEIYDEYELTQELVEKITDNQYRLFGKVSIKTVNIELDSSIPEDEDTIAGFLLSQLERIPRPGESFEFFGYQFIIERASRKRLISIVIKKI